MSSEIVALPIEKEFDDLLKSFSVSDTGPEQPAYFYSSFKKFYDGRAKGFIAVEEKRKHGNIVTEDFMGTSKNLIDYFDSTHTSSAPCW